MTARLVLVLWIWLNSELVVSMRLVFRSLAGPQRLAQCQDICKEIAQVNRQSEAIEYGDVC